MTLISASSSRRAERASVAAVVVAAVAVLATTLCCCASAAPTRGLQPKESSAVSAGPTLIKTLYGPVQGYVTKNARIWRGIPYATPTVGDLRWTDPVPHKNWTTALNASSFGPACPQRCELPPLGCQKEQSEDCLFLNVYSPLAPGNYPVLVWFHGGRYLQGSEGVELYDPQLVVDRNNVVVVTVNYRLGVLGFLAIPELGRMGNYGSKDQQLSLKWVRDNIAAFSGNPNKVTIYGQSAGGSSVSVQLTAQSSFGLFHGAILESSPFSLPLLTAIEASGHYAVWANDAGCDALDLKCIRGISADEVVAAEVIAEKKIWLLKPLVLFFPFTPVIDGTFLASNPFTAIQNGQYAKVPIMIGNVADEARMFTFSAFPKLTNKAEAEALIDVIFAGKHEPKAIMEKYPPPATMDDYRVYLNPPASDFVISCVSQNVSKKIASDGVPVYHYVFDHAWVEHGGWGPNYTFCEGYPCHGVELPFVFDSASLNGFPMTPKETTLAVQVSDYWANFAKNSVPSASNGPAWPKFTVDNQMTMNLTISINVMKDQRREYCEFWDNSPHGYIW